MNITKSFRPISDKTNDLKTEQDFRATCKWYEDQCSAPGQPHWLEYQEYLNHYHKITSLYLTQGDVNNKTKLIIYDTEKEREEVKILNTPTSLNWGSCITQLPNGELFCYGSYPKSGIALIIDENLEIRVLPSGIPCYYTSSIYPSNNVYCFGGLDSDRSNFNSLRKFDLIEDRWINLTPPPEEEDWPYLSALFNGNILISGWKSRNLMLYSIEIDSFSTIPNKFAKERRKILINLEKLYMIECGKNGFIYESEDEYNWKIISKSWIRNHEPWQVYCSYNKGGIYIATYYYFIKSKSEDINFYKFDLSQKVIFDV